MIRFDPPTGTLLKLGLAGACIALVVLWPRWRVELQMSDPIVYVQIQGPTQVKHNETVSYTATLMNKSRQVIRPEGVTFEWTVLETDGDSTILFGATETQSVPWKINEDFGIVPISSCQNNTAFTAGIMVEASNDVSSRSEVLAVDVLTDALVMTAITPFQFPISSQAQDVGVPIALPLGVVDVFPGTTDTLALEETFITQGRASRTIEPGSPIMFGVTVEADSSTDFGYQFALDETAPPTAIVAAAQTLTDSFRVTCVATATDICTFRFGVQHTRTVTDFDILMEAQFDTGLTLFCDRIGTVTLVEDLFRFVPTVRP